MSRRGNAKGSIFRRSDGRWAATVEMGAGGKRRRKTFYAASRHEVQEQLAAELHRRQGGMPTISGRTTVGEYLAHWLVTARPSVRARTWIRAEQYVRLHATPAIGRIPLARLEPHHLQELYARRAASGSSAMTVKHLHRMLHRAIGQAVRWGLCARNVVELVDPPRAEHREMKTLEPDQVRALFDAAAGERLSALYVIAIATGMRQGELLGLRWPDVDLDGGAVRVRVALERAADEVKLVEPKTARSRRQIIVGATAIAALRRHRAMQTMERHRLGAAWEGRGDFCDLVFTDAIGGPLQGSSVLATLRRLLAGADLPRIRFHDLRHTAATLMLGRGIHPKIVSEMLGHSSVAITLDLYSHVTPTMQREAAARMDDVLATR